jgi:hypothetical protein
MIWAMARKPGQDLRLDAHLRGQLIESARGAPLDSD